MKDAVVLVIICVFIGAGFLLWENRVPVHSLRAPDLPVEQQPAAKPAAKVAKGKSKVHQADSGESSEGEPAGQPAGKPVEEITGFDPQTVAVVTPAPAAAVVRRDPLPFPAVDQIRKGLRQDAITTKYGPPTVSTVTSTGGHMVETMVYARENGRASTVIRVEDGKVSLVYSQTQPVLPPGTSAPRPAYGK